MKMDGTFERIAGPCQGRIGGLAWDGTGLVFSAIDEGHLYRFDPESREVSCIRRYTNRTDGIAYAPDGTLFGCQEGGRRVIQFFADGSAAPTATRLDGQVHNHPCDLTIDRRGRVWFSDPHHAIPAYGPAIFPPLPHASVLRLEYDHNHEWRLSRVTFDTQAPRAVLLSGEEKTLYVAENVGVQASVRELRAYRLAEDGSAGSYVVLHAFGTDHRGPHRGIEGMCLDEEGNIVATAGSLSSGPGPVVMVLATTGRVLESHVFPADRPARCVFGGRDLATLYVGTDAGEVYRAEGLGRRGFRRW